MSSFVFYRFKSQKEPSRISFDGTGISVWDLKKEIIQENKMGKGADFDFAIYNADTEEEYTDDRALVSRSTSVLARRLPPSKPNRGNAQFYMAPPAGGLPATGYGGRDNNPYGREKATMSKRFDGGREEIPQQQESFPVVVPAETPGDEASAMAAMFAATSQQWQQTQNQMATATHIPRAAFVRPPGTRPAASGSAGPPPPMGQRTGGAAGQPERVNYSQIKAGESTKPPPTGYICYRCGQKGHWIQDCPTNSDKAWDDKPRIKRTTGIPKSFLTTVEGPAGENTPAGMMVTAEGGFVVARPDSASWLAHRAITKNLTANDIQNLAPTDPDLTCPICSKLLRDATLTPCCSTSFCEDCVRNTLLDNDFLCPECETRVKNLGKLTSDERRRERVGKYIEQMVEASREVIEVVEEVPIEEGKQLEKFAVEAEGGEAVVEDGVVSVDEKNGDNPVVPGPAKESTPAPTDVPIPTLAVSTADSIDDTTTPTKLPRSISVPSESSPGAATSPSIPSVVPPVAPTLQQQQLHQQLLMQQQRAMSMQQQQQSYAAMRPSPQMVQQQLYQLTMMLQNPQLHPQMRMQAQMQLQQTQMIAVQMGILPGGGRNRMGGAISAAYGGHLGAGNMTGGGGMSNNYQNHNFNNGRGAVPTAPAADRMSGNTPKGPRAASESVETSRAHSAAASNSTSNGGAGGKRSRAGEEEVEKSVKAKVEEA